MDRMTEEGESEENSADEEGEVEENMTDEGREDYCFRICDLKLGFDHHDANHFVHAAFEKCCGAYFFPVYRLVAALIFATWLAVDFRTESQRYYTDHVAFYFLFATNWGFAALVLSTCSHALITLRHSASCRRSQEAACDREMPFCYKIYWLLFETANNCALVISLCYWSFVYFYDNDAFLKTQMSRLKHTLNACWVVVDLFVVATPVRLSHVIYPFFVGIVYVAFTSAYFSAGGLGPNRRHYAYVLIDWYENPVMAALCSAGAFVCSIVAQLLLYVLFRIRESLARRKNGRRSGEKTRILQSKTKNYQSP